MWKHLFSIKFLEFQCLQTLAYLLEKQFNKKALSTQMDSMRQILRKIGNKDIIEIGRNDLLIALELHSKPNVKQVTISGRMRVFYTFLRWCEKNNLLMPFNYPSIQKGYYEKFIPPSTDEIERMLKFAPPHIQRVLILGVQWGTRIGPCELFRLKWKDVDFTQKLISIHGSKKNTNSAWREVPLQNFLVSILRVWRQEDKLFNTEYIIHYKGKSIKKIQTAWTKTLKRAGISRRIRPYDLRHAFATELIATGTDIGTVAKLMGHSSPTMVLEHYQYVMDKQKLEAIAALPKMSYVPGSMCPKKEGFIQ